VTIKEKKWKLLYYELTVAVVLWFAWSTFYPNSEVAHSLWIPTHFCNFCWKNTLEE